MVKRLIIDRPALFAAVRKDDSGVFNRRLAQSQVEGVEAIMDSADRNGVFDINHIAQILAHVYHETGTYMLGIKETVMPSHTNKRPADSTVIQRLDKAFAAGQLPWVKTPYWRDGGFGRGPIQITHWSNYLKMGTALGVPLREHPELALDTKVGADIAVVGMAHGLFTGKKLSDYKFPAALDAAPDQHPRRIVNGKDGTDMKISGYHRGFHKALTAAGFRVVETSEITADDIQVEKITANTITTGPAVPSIVLVNKIPATPSVITDELVGTTAISLAPTTSIWAWLASLALKLTGVRNV
ncbi:hypothetical protein [Rhizobium sp. Leaf383]|uniref:hypothetical protein n=1 Tax=Rhizobium sp. Leaf383 TaxID=1736357 RepID=UPI00071515F5|nr:hypothetical protein [Rhizobium sp. Leaf383]KQS84342.1 hypothetical protein ASG58_21465 [Rhizobium sp. Leaf383]